MLLRLLIFAMATFWLGCSGVEKRLDYGRFESAAMQYREMNYAVWEPPDRKKNEKLPIVLFLHGGGDDHLSFDRHDVTQALDDAHDAGTLPRAVIVLPQGDLGFWRDWYDGSRLYASWVLKELLPRVQEQYNTGRCPDDCHIMGVSMGGAGTLSMILDKPTMFRSATVISAPVFDSATIAEFTKTGVVRGYIPVGRIWGEVIDVRTLRYDDPFQRWQKPQDLQGLSLYLAWAEGDREGIVGLNHKLKGHLSSRGIPFMSNEFAGGHNWKSWTPVILDALAKQLANNPSQSAEMH